MRFDLCFSPFVFIVQLTRSSKFFCDRTETEYVSQMLTKVKRFAHHHGCHVWFVAHPRQVSFRTVIFPFCLIKYIIKEEKKYKEIQKKKKGSQKGAL